MHVQEMMQKCNITVFSGSRRTGGHVAKSGAAHRECHKEKILKLEGTEADARQGNTHTKQV